MATKSKITEAVESVAAFRECLTDPHDFDLAVAGLVDSLTAYDSDWRESDTEPQLVKLVKEIHEAVVSAPEGRLVFEVEDGAEAQRLTEALRPGDIVLAKDSGITVLNGTVTDQSPGAVVEHPPTGYGVRIYYADGTMEEIHDVDGVQLANLNDGTFPFGFMPIDGGDEDAPAQHRAGYWDEEGAFEAFSSREQPRPGW
jgi:hypothetical protein